MAFVSIGVQTAKTAVAAVASQMKAECLKKGVEGSEAFKACYAKTQEMLDTADKLWPQLEELQALAAAAIKADEQKKAGQTIDYVTPIKKGVCLLTKLTTWLPEKYRKKIMVWLQLVSAYACDQPMAANGTAAQQRYAVQQLYVLLQQIIS
jgi:hypothetical protein